MFSKFLYLENRAVTWKKKKKKKKKGCRAGQATYDNMAHAHGMLDT